MELVTASLRLIPLAPRHLLTLIEAPERFPELFGHHPANGLREFFDSGEISPGWLDSLRDPGGPDPWRFGFALVDSSDTVVGLASFKGSPDADGAVEIAYGIVAESQGRGLATEAAAALVGFALEDARVRTVRAHTLPERNASTRVLEKCGFRFVGEVVDPEDGLVWRWERLRSPA